MMIKKGILFLAFVFYGVIFSQQKEMSYTFLAKYKLSYKTSLEQKNYLEETFFLFFNKNESFFISENELKKDSSKRKVEGVLNINELMKYRTYFTDRMYYNALDDVSQTFLKYNHNFFSFEQNENKPNWIIGKEKKIVNKIGAQSAKVSLLGREWTAWFSTDYPFPFGPFPFRNLPGLIIKIEDSESSYVYELVELKKHNQEYHLPKMNKLVSKEDYYKLLKEKHFSRSMFNNFSIPNDPDMKIRMQQTMESRIKRMSNYPIDREMRYIFK